MNSSDSFTNFEAKNSWNCSVRLSLFIRSYVLKCLILLQVQNYFGPSELFWTVQIVLVGSKSFWSRPNHFGRVQIILVRFKLDFFFTRPKLIGLVKNDWYSTKIIWMVQNHFGPIEGQGINVNINNQFRRFVVSKYP